MRTRNESLERSKPDIVCATQMDDVRRLITPEVLREIRGMITSRIRSHDMIDDLLQETVCRALKRMDHAHARSITTSYLYVIARNIIIDVYRREEVQRSKVGTIVPYSSLWDNEVPVVGKYYVEEETIGGSRVKDTEQYDDLIELSRLVCCLTPEQAHALFLTDVYGYHIHEVANILDIDEGAVKSRICRARRYLALCHERPTPMVRNRFSTLPTWNRDEVTTYSRQGGERGRPKGLSYWVNDVPDNALHDQLRAHRDLEYANLRLVFWNNTIVPFVNDCCTGETGLSSLERCVVEMALYQGMSPLDISRLSNWSDPADSAHVGRMMLSAQSKVAGMLRDREHDVFFLEALFERTRAGILVSAEQEDYSRLF